MPLLAERQVKNPPPSAKNYSAVWRTYGEASAPSEEESLKQHMPLVRSVVDRMRASLPSHIDVEDLYSVGLLGLIQAQRRFDPTHGITFASYATMRIRGAVLDELRRVDWMSRTLRDKAKHVSEVISGIEQKLGRPATEAEVAEELGMSSQQYSELLDEIRPVSYVELDALAGEDEDASLHEVVADERSPDPAQLALKQELIQLVVDRLQKLPEMQRKILAMYYFENLRLAEIARVFGVTESRICQIHTQAVLSLKTFIRSAAAR
jgi:RNA polymerase sigma factor for flagellar operon FliA